MARFQDDDKGANCGGDRDACLADDAHDRDDNNDFVSVLCLFVVLRICEFSFARLQNLVCKFLKTKCLHNQTTNGC